MRSNISIIIPTYNEERYLPRTLDSIHRLTRKPDEVIVIDSSSAKATANIAQQFGAKVIRITGRGIGRARQKGLEAARGDMVAFTDADTIVPARWLSIIESTLLLPAVVGTFGSYRVIDGWLPYRFCVNQINPAIFILAAGLNIPYAVGQNLAFHRRMGLRAGGFPVGFQSVEDVEMIRRLKKMGRVVYRKDNWVSSSGRRGNEGMSMIPRKFRGLMRYAATGRANDFSFPDFR